MLPIPRKSSIIDVNRHFQAKVADCGAHGYLPFAGRFLAIAGDMLCMAVLGSNARYTLYR